MRCSLVHQLDTDLSSFHFFHALLSVFNRFYSSPNARDFPLSPLSQHPTLMQKKDFNLVVPYLDAPLGGVCSISIGVIYVVE